MSKIISIYNFQPKSGKTTIAVNLASHIRHAYTFIKLAVVDTDDNRKAADWIRKCNCGVNIPCYRFKDGKDTVGSLNDIVADVIIVDVKSSDVQLVPSILYASDVILIPVDCSVFDNIHIHDICNYAHYNIVYGNIKNILFVFNNINNCQLTYDKMHCAFSTHGKISNISILHRQAYADSLFFAAGVNVTNPVSAASQEIGMLSEEILGHLNLA